VPQPQPDASSFRNRDREGVATNSHGNTESEAMLYCPVCSMKLESRKCKLFCTQCGYYMSCADYY
jgi:hypothetical protein